MVLDQELYEHAFKALAKIEVPNFSNFDEGKVYEAFSRLYNDEGAIWTPSQKTLEFMASEVSRLSGGQTILDKADFMTGIKGPNQPLLLKTRDGKEQKAYFGPYYPPFGFMD